MTKEDLETELHMLEIQYLNDKKKLYRKFAHANNPYKIGDVISDHTTTIRITEEPKVYTGLYGVPQCVYSGIQLNKDGQPSKKQKETKIYQSNIINP